MSAPSIADLDAALAHYEEHGYARLGKLLPDDRMQALRDRTDDIMMGRVTYDSLFFQKDTTTGRYEDLGYGQGWEGPSLNYRKIEKLEQDPLFRAWICDPVFEPVARRVYNTDISMYRALIFNKAAETGGSALPWHQDGGNFWGLSEEPRLQVWTALDDAPLGGGCVEIVPGSHRRGLVTKLGGVVPDNFLTTERPEEHVVSLPVVAGEVLLIHNHAWHRSGRSGTGKARRGLTVCYMSAETRCLRKKRAPRQFFRPWG